MRYGLDAEYAPGDDAAATAVRALGWEWMAGYVGGAAANIWLAADWDRVEKAGFALLPIWVAPLVGDAGRQAGVDDGNACLVKLQELQLADVVVLDIEDGLRPEEYAGGFIDALHAGLCDVAIYGSRGSVGMHIDVDAWWLAEWSWPHTALGEAPPDWSYWQYNDGPRYDYNVARDEAMFASRPPVSGR